MRARALLLVASICACSGIRADVEYDHAVDFRRFHTYSWGAFDGGSSPAIDRRIIAAVDAQLMKNGLVRVERRGDLEVRLRASVDPAYEVIAWEHGRGPRWLGMPDDVEVRRESIGAIQVDLLDRVSQQRAWRGLGVGTVSTDASLEECGARIDESARKLFRSFPPRGK
ncbi:MAG TPA: DUF4136 domain-containing protein [Myxococcales bacterium]|nr:DUF4136 domain-containing protein [Myxococcales bacterium]